MGHVQGKPSGDIVKESKMRSSSSGPQAKYRLSCLKRLQITKKAGSDPQGPSSEHNRAGVSVMGSFLDQTARATADQKVPIEAMESADPLTSMKPSGKIFGADHPEHSLKPHAEGSSSNDLRGGIVNSKFDSAETPIALITPSRHPLTGRSTGAEKNTLSGRGFLTHYLNVGDREKVRSQQSNDIIRVTLKVICVKLRSIAWEMPLSLVQATASSLASLNRRRTSLKKEKYTSRNHARSPSLPMVQLRTIPAPRLAWPYRQLKPQPNLRVKSESKKAEKLINCDHTMTRPTEERHPSLTKLSINEMRLHQNLRSLSNRVLMIWKGEEGHNLAESRHTV